MRLTQLAHGVLTVLRRRGPRYVGYLLTGVALPSIVHRYGSDDDSGVSRAFLRLCERAGAPVPASDAAALSEAAARAGDSADQWQLLMEHAHARLVTGIRHLWGPAAAGGGEPRARLRVYRSPGVLFRAARDADRRAFNDRFGASLLTERRARELLRERKAAVPPGYRDYAPIDFGGGLTIGSFVLTDSGTGRWDFFNGGVVAPLVRGRRVLDLGSNNGSLPLMMLRAGARSVVAVEYTSQLAEFARLNADILSWRDMRDYDLRVVTGDMRLFADGDLGRFDVVTAFCSLYYLPEADMARVIRAAADMGATLVLQANESIHNLPARAADLLQLMRQNGYQSVVRHDYAGFGRPILVGSADAGQVWRTTTGHAAEPIHPLNLPVH